MQYAIGLTLALAVALFAAAIGFDRERSFYPLVLIVVASYYLLFAVMAKSTNSLLAESLPALLFIAAAAVSFRKSLWLAAAGLAFHALFDLIHPTVIHNPGVPPWWPGFCSSYDLTAAATLALLLLFRKPQKTRL